MKNPNEPTCWQALYVLANKAFIPTTYDTDAGFLLEDEPYCEIDYTDRSALSKALSQAIDRGNPCIPAPTPEEVEQKRSMERLANARSWADLERKSICFSITCWPSEFVVKAWGRATNGTWGSEKDPALNIRIPASEGAEGVAGAILQHLKTRTDLPGLRLAQIA